jgi:BirA family transcriptional regulator, biotin operon repressor / biotin---[acetyl-CoA-carboxylase] ligase
LPGCSSSTSAGLRPELYPPGEAQSNRSAWLSQAASGESWSLIHLTQSSYISTELALRGVASTIARELKAFQPTIIRFDSLPSTNDEAARQALRGAAEGLCIVAREQTAGRGRLQRTWISPPGAGLYFSIVLRPRIVTDAWTLLPLMAGLAVHDSLLDACDLQTDIKWPNDILADGRKLGGILAETVETDSGRAVIIGIGVNITSRAFPSELRGVATSIEEAGGQTIDAETLLQSLIESLVARYELLQSSRGPEEIRSRWTKRSSYAEGKRVQVAGSSESFDGVTRGLESDGALRVETDAGEIRIVHAGDVTFVRAASYQ